MNIGLNGRYLGQNKNGVARYLYSLLEQWAKNASHHTFFVYVSTEQLTGDDVALFSGHPHMILRRIPRPFLSHSFHLWYNWSLPRAIRRDKIDFFFSPDYFLPPNLGKICRSMTIHDVSYLAHPEWFPPLYRLYCNVYSRRAALHAHRIITVSQYSKNEILQHIPVPESRVVVTPEAADPKFQPGEKETETLNALGIQHQYFLYVGKILNRRHLLETLKAFQAFRRMPGAPVIQFAIRGDNETSPKQDIESFTESLNKEFGNLTVVWLPYLDDSLLVKCYQGAEGFFYLSSYEGFGLPVLEALATGTPTVTMKTSSIPEVAGDAAFYASPTDTVTLARLMFQLGTDQALREETTLRSLKQAAQFSWEQTADATLKIIEKTYAESSR